MVEADGKTSYFQHNDGLSVTIATNELELSLKKKCSPEASVTA